MHNSWQWISDDNFAATLSGKVFLWTAWFYKPVQITNSPAAKILLVTETCSSLSRICPVSFTTRDPIRRLSCTARICIPAVWGTFLRHQKTGHCCMLPLQRARCPWIVAPRGSTDARKLVAGVVQGSFAAFCRGEGWGQGVMHGLAGKIGVKCTLQILFPIFFSPSPFSPWTYVGYIVGVSSGGRCKHE